MMSWPGSPRTRMRPIGPGAPMRVAGSPRSTLWGRASVRSGRGPSPGVDDQHPDAPRACKPPAAWGTGRLQPRDIVAERGAEPTGFEKIALHVDDHQRRFVQVDRERLWFSLQLYAWHRNLPRLQQRHKD